MHGGLGGAAAWFCPLPRRCCPDRIARGHPSCLGSILLFIHSSLPIGTFLSWWLLVYACPLVLWCALWCSGALWCSVVLAVVCAACGFWLVFALFFDDSLVMFDDDHFLRSNIRANVGGVRNGLGFGGRWWWWFARTRQHGFIAHKRFHVSTKTKKLTPITSPHDRRSLSKTHRSSDFLFLYHIFRSQKI